MAQTIDFELVLEDVDGHEEREVSCALPSLPGVGDNLVMGLGDEDPVHYRVTEVTWYPDGWGRPEPSHSDVRITARAER